MKIFNWNPDKNDQLILERNVSFEKIVADDSFFINAYCNNN